jgi:hypothetical protein
MVIVGCATFFESVVVSNRSISEFLPAYGQGQVCAGAA